MSDESKAVIDTIGKIAENGTETKKFLSKHFSGTLEEIDGFFKDKISYLRFKNQLSIIEKVNSQIENKGLGNSLNPLPLKLAFPLWESASLEEEESLQDLWANLLTNSINSENDIDLKYIFIDILKRLTPFEAKILKKIYEVSYEKSYKVGVLTNELPGAAKISFSTIEESKLVPSDEVALAISTLSQLGCLHIPSYANERMIWKVCPTILGRKFINACSNT